MKCLNLGCGNRYLQGWVNIDFHSNNESVIQYDLTKGIPYESETFEVVYHSHVLEHFSKNDGELFMQECYRVLKPGGIIRIAVPNLEEIVKLYLDNLSKVRNDPSKYNEENYYFSFLEIYDQVIRTKSGGEMGEIWANPNLENEDWLKNRMGEEFINFRLKKNEFEKSESTEGIKIVTKRNRFVLKIIRKLLTMFCDLKDLEWIIEDYKFRSSGELHKYMYDSYSLEKLLKRVGFSSIAVVESDTSTIQNWEEFCWLDIENGKTRKPDSFFIEAKK
jgi:predicted SAM-dependent methyltransferase